MTNFDIIVDRSEGPLECRRIEWRKTKKLDEISKNSGQNVKKP